MTDLWGMWKRGFGAWEQATTTYMEKTLSNAAVLEPAASVVTALAKTKAAADHALHAWWSMWGLPTRRDQERTLHKLNQLESKLLDLEEQLAARK